MRRPERPLLMVGSLLAESYEVRALLGSGGMAQVFAAHDIKLDRRVAVKAARPGAADALRAEGRVLAAMRHPSIVGILHSGTHRSVDYLVLDYVGGPSLRGYIEALRSEGIASPIGDVVAMLCGIAEALAVVHGSGLSHGDVKPDNVMLASHDRVVLTDFGLASPEFHGRGDLLSGSPEYMAPEVIACGVERGDGHLADLYAVGIVAYELLVGRTPFESEDMGVTLRGHALERPRDPRELRFDVPDGLALLVLDLLSKDPHHRPESAEYLARSLQRCQWPLSGGSARPGHAVEARQNGACRGDGIKRAPAAVR